MWKKKGRSFIALMIGMMLLVTTLAVPVGVAAKTQLAEEMIFDLKAFHILQGDPDGDLRLDEKITRAEFSALVVRLLGWDEALGVENRFADVREDDWFCNAVNFLASIRVINGYSATEFGPNDYILDEQAHKMLVCALGYSIAAEQAGGYPHGYSLMAGRIGLLQDVENEEAEITRADVLMMIYNALDAELLEVQYGDDMEMVKGGNTLRTMLLSGRRREWRVNDKGILTANHAVGLLYDIPGIESNQVEINGQLFDCGDTNAQELLGMEVEYYASVDIAGRRTLTDITPTKKNVVLELDQETFQGIGTDYKVRYDTGDGVQRVASLNTGSLIYVHNYRVVSGYRLEDISLTNGTITFIDNNEDKQFEIIMVEDFESLRVEKYEDNKAYFANNKTFGGSRLIEFASTNTNIKYIVEDENGKLLSVDDLGEYIKEDSILSLVFSNDQTVLKCIVANQSVQGTVTKIGARNSVFIDDEEYFLDGYLTRNVSPGDTIIAYLDYTGKIAEMEEDELGESSYAYVLGAISMGTFGGEVNLKILVPGSLSVDYEVDESDEDNITQIPALKAHNSGVETVVLSDKVRVNGSKMDAATCLRFFSVDANRVIEYKKNSEGKVVEVVTPEQIVSGNRPKYNAYERIFGKTGIGAYAIDDDSVGICIPENAISSEEDYYAKVQLNNDQTYTVRGYNLDPETLCAELIVVTTVMDSSAQGVINDSSKMAVLESVEQVLIDGENRYRMVFCAEGTKMERLVQEDSSAVAQMAGMRNGAVFYYAESADEEVNTIEIVENLDGLNMIYDMGNQSTERWLYGDIVQVDWNQISDLQARRIHIVTLTTNPTYGTTSTVEINARNTPSIYVYNSRTEEVSVGSVDDISPNWKNSSSEPVRMYAHIVYSKVKGIVIVK